IWRLNACERLTLPPARILKRLAAPLLVFILGMIAPLSYDGRCFPVEKLDNPYATFYRGTICYIASAIPFLPKQLEFSAQTDFKVSIISCLLCATTPSPSACLPSWETAR